MQYKLTDVLVTGVAVEGDVTQPRPAETVTLDYGKIQWTYTPIDPGTGTAGTNITTSWDLMANEGRSRPNSGDVSEPVIGDAQQRAAQEIALRTDTAVQPLEAAAAAVDFFLKIDDIPGESTDDDHKGWIEITSFSHAITQPVTTSTSGAPRAARSTTTSAWSS